MYNRKVYQGFYVSFFLSSNSNKQMYCISYPVLVTKYTSRVSSPKVLHSRTIFLFERTQRIAAEFPENFATWYLEIKAIEKKSSFGIIIDNSGTILRDLYGTTYIYAPTSHRQYIHIYIYIYIYTLSCIKILLLSMNLFFFPFWRTFLRTLMREIRIVYKRKRTPHTRTRIHTLTHICTNIHTHIHNTDYQ